MTRAAAHVALANRDSRLGLYDLRRVAREGDRAAAGRIPRRGVAGRRRVVPGADCGRARQRDRRVVARAPGRGVPHDRRPGGLSRRHAAIRKIEKRWPSVMPASWANG
mgnify:CR=1 FL=1